jgi:WhiB family redox-sensing transcriptional regulator
LFQLDPPPFVADALCAQTDPEIFFPEKGESSARARSICLQCPVRRECLLYAIENNERHGVWGGLPTRARFELKWRHRRVMQVLDAVAS